MSDPSTGQQRSGPQKPGAKRSTKVAGKLKVLPEQLEQPAEHVSVPTVGKAGSSSSDDGDVDEEDEEEENSEEPYDVEVRRRIYMVSPLDSHHVVMFRFITKLP